MIPRRRSVAVGSCSATPTFVRSAQVAGTGDQNITLGANVAAGDTVIAGVFLVGTSTTATVTMSGCNAFTENRSQEQTADGIIARLYSAYCPTGGSTTVAIDQSSTGNIRAAAMEWDAILSSSPIDVMASAQGEDTSPDSGSNTTTCAKDLLVGLSIHANIRIYTPGQMGTGSSATLREETPASPDTRLVFETAVPGTTGTYKADFTTPSGPGLNQWVSIFASYKSE
jgi:hypothetical protein